MHNNGDHWQLMVTPIQFNHQKLVQLPLVEYT